MEERGSCHDGSTGLLPGGHTGARHGQHTARALDVLRLPEHQLRVTDLALSCKGRTISLIGIEDNDHQHSLGNYQNTAYFLIIEDGQGLPVPLDVSPARICWHWAMVCAILPAAAQ